MINWELARHPIFIGRIWNSYRIKTIIPDWGVYKVTWYAKVILFATDRNVNNLLIEEKEDCSFTQSLNINTKIFASSGSGSWLRSSQAFLFSVVNPQGMGPTKLLLTKDKQNAIYCNSSYGPTFGGGHDLYISGNANSNTSSYSLLNSYECPSGQQSTFFTGAQNFCVIDYEVFGLHNWRQTLQWITQVNVGLTRWCMSSHTFVSDLAN